MKELSRYFDLFKDIWSNRRYRSIIILAGYVIFFSYIIICLRMPNKTEQQYENNDNKDNVKQDLISSFENDSNYKITYMVNESKLYNYEKSGNLTLLEIDNIYYKVYYNILTGYDISTGKDLDIKAPNFTVKFWRFNKENIAKLISEGNIKNTKNDYNGSVLTTYEIPCTAIFKNINASLPILDGKDEKKAFITLITTIKDDEVINVSLDLTNYYHLFEDNNLTYKLDLDFKGN